MNLKTNEREREKKGPDILSDIFRIWEETIPEIVYMGKNTG